MQWVLSLGHEAEVIEPEELRERLKESLTKTLAAYSDCPLPVQEDQTVNEHRREIMSDRKIQLSLEII